MTLSMHGVSLRNVHTSVRLSKKKTYNSYAHSPRNIIPQSLHYHDFIFVHEWNIVTKHNLTRNYVYNFTD